MLALVALPVPAAASGYVFYDSCSISVAVTAAGIPDVACSVHFACPTTATNGCQSRARATITIAGLAGAEVSYNDAFPNKQTCSLAIETCTTNYSYRGWNAGDSLTDIVTCRAGSPSSGPSVGALVTVGCTIDRLFL
ncbi:MAG: hypothetical protein QOI63_327 [Thermoplasmata archaeon]|jgi:hypothetical protein|nr:hypothetical protein [Thermoplasmata archaeon]